MVSKSSGHPPKRPPPPPRRQHGGALPHDEASHREHLGSAIQQLILFPGDGFGGGSGEQAVDEVTRSMLEFQQGFPQTWAALSADDLFDFCGIGNALLSDSTGAETFFTILTFALRPGYSARTRGEFLAHLDKELVDQVGMYANTDLQAAEAARIKLATLRTLASAR